MPGIFIMTPKELAAAVKKFLPEFKADPGGMFAKIDASDNSPEDIQQVKDALETALKESNREADFDAGEESKNISPAPKKLFGTGKKLEWYDEFKVRIRKESVTNPFTNIVQSIIVGWAFEQKMVAKKLEPSAAKFLNSFANGLDATHTGNYLFPKDKAQSGHFMKYDDFAKEHGVNPKKDINVILRQYIG